MNIIPSHIAIFDDNKNIRNSILLLLNTDPSFEVVGIYSDARHCVEKIALCKPDIILLDIEMPGVTGIDLVRLIKREFPLIQILIQTLFQDEETIDKLLKAGASGYILKSNLSRGLQNTIRSLEKKRPLI